MPFLIFLAKYINFKLNYPRVLKKWHNAQKLLIYLIQLLGYVHTCSHTFQKLSNFTKWYLGHVVTHSKCCFFSYNDILALLPKFLKVFDVTTLRKLSFYSQKSRHARVTWCIVWIVFGCHIGHCNVRYKIVMILSWLYFFTTRPTNNTA